MSYRSSICAFALAAALLATPSAAQVVDFGKYPNFKGQWVRTGNPNNWSALAGPPPLTPEYQKVFDETSRPTSQAGGPGNWPSTFCIPAGMPAMMSFYDPVEIIVMPDDHLHPDQPQRRFVSTDLYRRPRLADRVPSSLSRATRSASGSTRTATASTTCSRSRRVSSRCPRGYDTSGLPFHKDNKTVIKERIYLDKADRNTLYDQITVIDHAMTRPYAKLQKATRNPDPRPLWHLRRLLGDNTCVRIGTEPYYPQRRRQADAVQEEPGAAGFELFQAGAVASGLDARVLSSGSPGSTGRSPTESKPRTGSRPGGADNSA